MAQGAARGIDEADAFTIDGLEFVPSWERRSQPGSLTLLKAARMVPLYQRLLDDHPHPRMVELGISQGGSVALLALLSPPEKFVAIELDANVVEPLLQALADHGLAETVKPYFGVDQGDKARVGEIVEAEFGGALLDVVVDDASHLYRPTVASFEVLFPLLRPGGTYVIEDWSWQDLLVDRMMTKVMSDPSSDLYREFSERVTDVLRGEVKPEPPLSRIALELCMAVSQSDGAVADVRVDENWITVVRGQRVLDPTQPFHITDLYRNSHHQLAE